MALAAPKPVHPAVMLLLAGFAVTTLLAGCSGGKKLSASGTSGLLPDSEVEDFTVTETDSGKTEWTLFAKQAATFTARDLVTARTVRIDFFGDDGKKSSELIAREGEIYQRTRDMTARGNVVLQTTEGTRMTTEELHFSNEPAADHVRPAGARRARRRRARGHRLRERPQPAATSSSSTRCTRPCSRAPARSRHPSGGAQVTSADAPAAARPATITTEGLVAEGLMRYYGKWRVVQRRVAAACGAARSWACSGPTAPASRTTFHMIVGLLRPNAGTHPARRTRHHRASRCSAARGSASATWRRSPASSAGSPCARTSSRCSRPCRSTARAPDRAARRAARRPEPHAPRGPPGAQAFGRRAPPRRDHARARRGSPSFMLLDEPFVGIDPIAVEEIQDIIQPPARLAASAC